MEAEQFSLCWNNFHNNLRTGFQSLLQDEDLVDVTLAAEGRYIKAHKTVLSVCSPYFKELFRVNPCKHPIVILQDVNYSALNNLLQFMYQGEVSVRQEEIPVFMRVAATLKIKGLTDNAAPNNSSVTNGVDDSSIHRSSPYANSESNRQIMKRTRPAKKIIRPIQHLRPIESPKTVGSSSPSINSPQPPPMKKSCVEDSERKHDRMRYPVEPKPEPIYTDDDEYNDEKELNMSSIVPKNEPSHSSGSWTPDEAKYTDTSSPGTLQCVIGKRGIPRLIVDGHVFFKKSTYKGKSFWYCKQNRTTFKCPAVCWTFYGEIIKWPESHTHKVLFERLHPTEDTEVPIEKMQDVLIKFAN